MNILLSTKRRCVRASDLLQWEALPPAFDILTLQRKDELRRHTIDIAETCSGVLAKRFARAQQDVNETRTSYDP